MESFRKDDMIVQLEHNNDESREQFLIRANFVLNNLEKAPIERLVEVSYVFLNKYHLKQKFSKAVDKMLEKYDCTVI